MMVTVYGSFFVKCGSQTETLKVAVVTEVSFILS